MSDKSILILTLTGGGGHIQAAKAKYYETKASRPDALILEQDVLFDWVSKYLGVIVKHLWGSAQAKGNVFFLVWLSSGLRLADIIFWIPLFLSALKTCIKHDLDRIIDTQPLGTSAIIKAIRLIKWWKGKEIAYEKVITDLPTKEVKHFFSGIKHLSPKDRPFLKVLTTKPILEKGETESLFWETNCNLSIDSILYQSLPLRPAFSQYTNKKSLLSIDISFPSPSDLHLTHKIISQSFLTVGRFKDHLSIPIAPEDKVSLIMLGANPNPNAILSYVNHFIRILKEPLEPTRKDLLFIFCSSQVFIKPSLREELLRLVQTTKNYPKNLSIIPISHQNDQIIAPLLHRSNATLTKSGGLTSMELLTVSNGKIWIHQEPPAYTLPKIFLKTKPFHEGMPPWERGNARYLEIKKGAKLITPTTFETVTKDYFPTPEKTSQVANCQ